MRERIEEEKARGYATRLAVVLWEKHYKTDAPDWKPLPDLLGVLTQIDNMTTGLVRRRCERYSTHACGDFETMEPDIIRALQFVKVSTTHNGEPANIQQSGHLTAISCRMLLTELERNGFRIVRITTGER